MPASATSSPTPQLDLFADSRDVMLRNDLRQAIEARDAGAARLARQALAAAYPDEPLLAPFEVLIEALAPVDAAPFADHDAATAAFERVALGYAPAAESALGSTAAAWLGPVWSALAERSASLAFDPAHAAHHGAALWLRAGQWARAEAAVAGIESWRRIPLPLGWMLEAQCRLGRLDSSWPLLAELAWLAPKRLAALRPALRDPLLGRLLARFDASFEPALDDAVHHDLAWFPAWLLIDSPALAPRLAPAQPGKHQAPERAMRVLLELLGLERQGRHAELIARRRELRDLHAPLHAAYMATR